VALVLTVGEQWRAAVRDRAAARPGLVPVVKGNGYGFGRTLLASEAKHLGVTEIAVGTMYEVDSVRACGLDVVVLTPAVVGDAVTSDIIATVGHDRDLVCLAPSQRVIVKVAGSMHRYGGTVAEALALANRVGERLHGFAVHLPLGQSVDQAISDLDDVARTLPAAARLYVSHLGVDVLAVVRDRFPHLDVRCRVGTALWLDDKSHLKLSADVIDVRPVDGTESAGYRQGCVSGRGSLVMISAGTAHGVQPLADGRSPFHFARTRLPLHEAPHMHTSMAFVPAGEPCPVPGDRVDVQQPLTRVWPDRVEFIGDQLP
jgi:alanine racemase